MPSEKAKHELAYEDYLAGIKRKDIAAKYGVSLNTVKSWHSRHWKSKGVHPKTLRGCTPKKDAPFCQESIHTPEKQMIDSVEENEALTDQQKLFCLYYIHSFNATQSYLKAYGCSYASAMTSAYDLLRIPKIKDEIKRLKVIKNEAILFEIDDLVELHMRIAGANIGDFADFGTQNRIKLHNGAPVKIKRPNTEDTITLKEKVNYVYFKDSGSVDGQLIAEISQGRDGAKIKLRNQENSMRFLERYFEANPMDRHKKEYDQMRLRLEMLRLESTAQPENTGEPAESDSFYNALLDATEGVWNDGEE